MVYTCLLYRKGKFQKHRMKRLRFWCPWLYMYNRDVRPIMMTWLVVVIIYLLSKFGLTWLSKDKSESKVCCLSIGHPTRDVKDGIQIWPNCSKWDKIWALYYTYWVHDVAIIDYKTLKKTLIFDFKSLWEKITLVHLILAWNTFIWYE